VHAEALKAKEFLNAAANDTVLSTKYSVLSTPAPAVVMPHPAHFIGASPNDVA